MKLIAQGDQSRLRCFSFAAGFAFLTCWPLSGAIAADKELESDSPLVHHYFSKGPHKHDAEWGYSGKQGPEFWGTLSPKYQLAKDHRQSVGAVAHRDNPDELDSHLANISGIGEETSQRVRRET